MSWKNLLIDELPEKNWEKNQRMYNTRNIFNTT